MFATLVVVGALAALLAVWALVHAVADKPVLGVQIPAMAVVEAGLVVQIVVAALGMSAAASDPILLWGYLVTQLVMLPLAFGWAFVERSRWSSVVLAVAALVVVVLQVRIWQLWQG